MAVRCVPSDVHEICPTDTAVDLAPFILAANALTDWVASQDDDGVLSAALLKEIERWLSAHFYAVRDDKMRMTSRATGPVSASFGGKMEMGLSATLYGQQAIALDISGALRRRDAGVVDAVGYWLGTSQ